jgi:ectoine hydroxylase-related dioxygenase (phytanoyl-CoA dioxygenase family)
MLDDRQIRAFFEDGFVVVPDVFSRRDIDTMRESFERLVRIAVRLGTTQMYCGSQFVVEPRADGPARIQRVVWCGAAEPALDRFGSDRRLVRMASQLLGSREMVQLINQAHFKLPGDGVEFPWHQDSVHRRYGSAEWRDVNGKGSYVQTVTAVDDVTADNGPLVVLPRSCRIGHVEPPDGESDWLPLDRVDPADAVAPTMSAGSVLLFGPYTFHRSGPNRSTGARRVLINGFAYPGANTRLYPGCGAGRLVRDRWQSPVVPVS